MKGQPADQPQEMLRKDLAAGSGPDGSPLGAPAIVAASGISVRLWRLYAYAWLVCLLFPILWLAQIPLAAAQLFFALAGIAVFVAVYAWVMWPHPLSSGSRASLGLRRAAILSGGLTGLVILLSLVYGSAFPWLFVGVSAVVGITLPPRTAFASIMGLTLLTLGISLAASGGIAAADWLQIVPLVLLVRGLGLDMAGLIRLADALRELHNAREELARQAVVEERLRLARDLHDLLGHTLSLITLKSELAGRMIDTDSARAAQEIREVEGVARQALREVREAVAGYREQTLQGELDAARQMLEAAGIALAVVHTAGPLPPDANAVLAWTVREGVTNVIRHSRARQCFIRITSENGSARAEVTNDGSREQDSQAAGRRGSGLSGLAERVAAQRGRIETGPVDTENGPGFRLRVEIPIHNFAAGEEI